VINNILYKFALDSHNLFQGSDYAAAKVYISVCVDMLVYVGMNVRVVCMYCVLGHVCLHHVYTCCVDPCVYVLYVVVCVGRCVCACAF
jgi:hypothetical protein